MISINFVALLGEIKDEVVHRETEKSQVANFTLVTKQKAHPNAKIDWITTWHNITAWGPMAKVVQHSKEGDVVQIDGAIETDSWTDQTTGLKRYKTVIKANNVTLMDEVVTEPKSRAAEVQKELDAPF